MSVQPAPFKHRPEIVFLMQAAEDAASAGSPAGVRVSILQAPRNLCQIAVAGAASAAGPQQALEWALQCVATVAPAAAALLHAQLCSDGCNAPEDVQASHSVQDHALHVPVVSYVIQAGVCETACPV